jgi:tripartite-type tricarboxylate transporter receptor subunit TctC
MWPISMVGQPLVVVNKPGAGGIIGAQYVNSAAPDGYTVLVAGGSESVSTPHFKELPSDWRLRKEGQHRS